MAAQAETLRLKDGSVLQGDVVQEGDTLRVRHAILGELILHASDLAEPVPALTLQKDSTSPANTLDTSNTSPARIRKSIDPADQSLFFLPTAFMPPKGSFTFRDFELFFLTGSFTPTASTSLTGGFLFPISPDFQLLTAGLKQQLFLLPEPQVALAITGTVAQPLGESSEGPVFVNSNLVMSWRQSLDGVPGPDGMGAHLALGYLGIGEGSNADWEGQFTLGLGVEGRISQHSKFILEYLNAAPFTDESEFDQGLLTLGIRLHGHRLAADIAAMRPLVNDSGNLLFLPLLIITYRF